MAEPVVTELVITSDNRGEVEYTQAMEAARVAAIAALAANDNFARSMRTSSDDARDAAERNGHVTVGLRQLAQAALDSAEAWAKKVAMGVAVVGVMSTLFRVLGPIYVAYKLLKFGIDTVTEAWALGNAKLAEYVALAEKATKSDLSTMYFQRITKAATDAKLPVDELTAALKKLQDVTAPKLGGSDAMNHLDELTKAGNFQGNTGVAQLQNANTTEEKLRAISNLIDQAMQRGERLAALDVSKTFLGDAVTSALAKDDEYLKKMVASADKIAATDLVSDEAVGNAVALQNRLDAAEKILSQRWHPIQDLLTSLGIAMKGAWVNIVESIASAVDWAGKLVEKLNGVPSKFWDYIQSGAKSFSDFTGSLGLNSTPEEMGIKILTPTDKALEAAKQRADALNNNPASIARQAQESDNVIRGVFKDKSKPIQKPEAEETASAYDRAEESLLRYIEVTKAAVISTGQGAEQQERLRAIAQLTAAGIKDGLTPAAAKAKAEMSGLADQAGAAALALAKAKVAADIKFNRDTAFLTQEDVSIASQLKNIYPDVATALASVEAQGIRANNTFRDISSTISSTLTSNMADMLDGTKSLGMGFSDMSKAIVRALNEALVKMLIVAPIMRSLQSLMGGFMGVSIPSVGETSALAGASSGMMGGISFPIIGANANGTDDWRGGLTAVNERGGEIMDLPSGTRIIPHDVSMKMASNDNGGTSFSIGDIYVSVPEGTSPENAAAIGAAVKDSIAQVVDERLAYHSRQRGMLNRAA